MEIVKVLLRHGADVKRGNEEGIDALGLGVGL